jgi:hypothetical protein
MENQSIIYENIRFVRLQEGLIKNPASATKQRSEAYL